MRNRKFKKPLLEHHYLPPDLWIDVFARLPPKTLLRFRCVCKSWCTLIDSRDFIYMHLDTYNNNATKPTLLVKESVPKTCLDMIFSIRRSDTFRKISQLGNTSALRMVYRSFMVHGLMLMDYKHELSLWNPSIRKSVKIPRCPFKYDFFEVTCFLGFAPSSNDYKVALFKLVDTAAFALGIAVYSLYGHNWRIKHNRIVLPRWCFELLQCRTGAVFSDGTMYWRPSQRKWYDESTELFCFDFDVEEFRCVKLPDMEEEMSRFLFVFCGSVAILGVSRVRTCIWVLEKNDGREVWRQHWEGETCSAVFQFVDDYSFNDYEILYIDYTGKLLIQSSKTLMAYDFRNNQTQCLGKSIPLRYVEIFVESLVLHKDTKLQL